MCESSIIAFIAMLMQYILQGPRIHAQTILGSIICFPNLYYDLPLLNPDSKDPQAYVCNNIKVLEITF